MRSGLGVVASTCVLLLAASATPAMAQVAPTERSRPLDPAELFRSLVDRYRNLTVYEDTVRLEHRTIDGERRRTDGAVDETAGGVNASRLMDCFVNGSTLAVRSSDLRSTAADCDAADQSLAGRLRLERQLWMLPHLSLRFAENPLKSMQGTGGELVPVAVEPVTIGAKELLRLHFVSSAPIDATNATDGGVMSPAPANAPNGAAPRTPSVSMPREATMDLFVNPRSMLIERVEHSRDIADGVRYEATLEITPERAVPAADRPQDEPTPAPATPEPPPAATPRTAPGPSLPATRE
ncbi:MAG: hypothetical protein JNM94_02295 [Phycisphaerae bacterium]|nr:hypothetical protein [Phycisphaerae bacterium]